MPAIETLSLPVELNGGAYTPAFMEAIKGGGAWSREARILLGLAAIRGVRLDEEMLVLTDVRGLRELRETLLRGGAR